MIQDWLDEEVWQLVKNSHLCLLMRETTVSRRALFEH